MTSANRLAATVGGKALEAGEARLLWQRFSSHMDVQENDFSGFARGEGWAHASVAVQGDVAILTLGNEAPPPVQTTEGGRAGRAGRAKGKSRARR